MKITCVALALLGGVAALFSQGGFGPPGPPPDGMPTDEVKAYLTLTDQQLQDLASIQSSLRTAEEPLMQQMREKMQALREALHADTVDSALVTQLKAAIASLQTELQSVRAPYRTKALAVLTEKQKTSLAGLQQALDLMQTAFEATALNLLDRPEGFPGGPGGPPPR